MLGSLLYHDMLCSAAEFIAHCTRVAEFNVGRDAFEGDVAAGDADDEPADEADADAAADHAADVADGGGDGAPAAGGADGEGAEGAAGKVNPFAEFEFHGRDG